MLWRQRYRSSVGSRREAGEPSQPSRCGSCWSKTTSSINGWVGCFSRNSDTWSMWWATALEAVDAVALAPYDAVFMDVQMPVMDGLTATTTIRGGHPPHGQPYIVGLTASVLIEDHQACTEAGMDDFLTKPARLDDYGAVLARAHSAHAGPPSFLTN